MFLHILKYDLKVLSRTKEFLFWLIMFPLILGTLFHVAFSNVFDNTMKFNTIKVEIINADSENCTGLKELMAELKMDDDKNFFDVKVSDEMSKKALKDGDIEGCIDGSDLSLVASPKGSTVAQTILKEVLENYRFSKQLVDDAFSIGGFAFLDNIDKLQKLLASDLHSVREDALTDDDMNVFNQYFFNIIAMVALYGSLTGLATAVDNQANLSPSGARKCIAPLSKLKSVAAGITASFIAQTVSIIIAISYTVFVLGKDLGGNLPLVYLGGIAGGFTGVSIGYFFGSFGTSSHASRSGKLSAFTMACCFMSGLMVSNMKLTIEDTVPILNRINPAALVSDIFYYMNIDTDYTMYVQNIISLIAIGFVFIAATLLLTRRKKYASL